MDSYPYSTQWSDGILHQVPDRPGGPTALSDLDLHAKNYHRINISDYKSSDLTSQELSALAAPGTGTGSDKQKANGGEPWRFENIWPIESLALFISYACQIALVVIITRMNDQPLDSWKTFVSLNTMVSILSTLSKSLVLVPVASCISQLKWHHLRTPHKLDDFELFDQASRGPGGSAWVVLRFPFRLVSLGAVITIVASAIGPFSQQILRFETREVEVPDDAVTFGFSHDYNTLYGFVTASGVIPVYVLDYSIRGAFLQGVYGLDQTPDFNCPSVCKWNSTYTTLGFDYECRNVTEATLATKVCTAEESDEEVDDYTTFLNHSCNMTTPGNLTLTTRLHPTSDQTLQYVTSRTYPDWNPLSTSSSQFLMPKTTLDSEFLWVAQYMADNAIDNGGWFNSNVTECTVSVAAWELSGVSANGSDFTISNRTKIPLGPSNPIQDMGGAGLAALNVTFNTPGIPTMSMGVYDWISITAFMLSQFTNITSIGGETTISADKGTPIFATSKYGNITEILERVTRRMTDSIGSSRTKQSAHGVVLQSVVFVRIVWLWYLLPLTVELGTFVLLAVTMWNSRRGKDMPLWKSSALALLSHDMEETGDSTGAWRVTTKLSNTKELEAVAENVACLKSTKQ